LKVSESVQNCVFTEFVASTIVLIKKRKIQ